MTGRKADLVAVGAVALGCRHSQLALRQFALQRFLRRNQRIAGTGDAHGLIDIRAAAERIADRTAEARRRAAERFDFSRMVVGFVFEHQKPVLKASVHFGRNAHGTGVDLLALIEIGKLSRLFQRLRGDRRDIPE